MNKVYRHSTSDLVIKLSLYGFLSLFLIGVPFFIRKLLKYFNESVILKDKTIVFKTGIITTKTNEIPYSKITNIQMESKIFSESIQVYTGQGQVVFDNLSKGSGIYNNIYAMMEAH